MVMRRWASGLGGVMMVRGRHPRVDRMSRVFCANGLAHVGGKRSADDHESECEREQASSHLCPSIPNRHQASSCLMSFSTVRPVARYDGRNEVLAPCAGSVRTTCGLACLFY